MGLPRRIASLTCSNTEIVAALGASERLIAVDSSSDWPPAVLARLPRLGPDLAIDLAALTRLEPDLVLASLSVPGMEKVVDDIEALGLPVLTLDPTSFSDVLADLRLVGRALGEPERGDALARELEATAAGLRASLPAWSRPPRVLVEWWPRPPIAAAHDSWITGLLERLGAVNALAHVPRRSAPLSPHDARAAAPDLVAVAWCGVRKLRPEVTLARAGWQDLPAIRHGRAVAIPESGLGRPGPRLAEGLRDLAAALRTLEV